VGAAVLQRKRSVDTSKRVAKHKRSAAKGRRRGYPMKGARPDHQTRELLPYDLPRADTTLLNPNEMRTMTDGTERNMVVVLWTLALLAAGAIILALFWV
jgi:hypothetical protein